MSEDDSFSDSLIMQPFNQKEKIENVICEDLSKV